MSKLTEKAVALLQEGEVNLVIGYEEGNRGTRPLFCRQAENADRLILDDRCTNNIAVYLTKRELTGTGKVAITATVPALRTVVQLAFENQLKEDNLLVLTVDGHGEVIQFKGFDEIKTYLADFPLTISEENLQLIDRLKKMSREVEILDGGNVEMHQMLCLPGCLSVVLLQPVYCGGQLSAVGTTLVCSADKYGVAD